MSFIIKPSAGIEIGKSNKNGIYYLPLKKLHYSRVGADIALYREGEYNGIFCIGIIMGEPIKSTLIPEEDQHLIQKRDFFQLPVYVNFFSIRTIFEKKYMNHLPSLNSETIIRVGRVDKLYLAWDLFQDLEHLKIHTEIQDSEEKYYLYKFHTLRENYFRGLRTWIKNEVFVGKNACSKCGIQGPERKKHEPYFFEFHEKTPVDFNGDYQEINPDNFEVLCGNCHKLAHNEAYFDMKPDENKFQTKSWWFGDPID